LKVADVAQRPTRTYGDPEASVEGSEPMPDPEALWEEHTHEAMTHSHRHYHVTHNWNLHVGGFEHLSAAHEHEHDHAAFSHAHYPHKNLMAEHEHEAHVHDHVEPVHHRPAGSADIKETGTL
jgi:hypothetical protein